MKTLKFLDKHLEEFIMVLLLSSIVVIMLFQTIFYKGIMPSEKVLDFPVDCNTLTGSVNL